MAWLWLTAAAAAVAMVVAVVAGRGAVWVALTAAAAAVVVVVTRAQERVGANAQPQKRKRECEAEAAAVSSGGPAAAGWGGALHFALTRLEGREGVSARWLPVAIEARCVLGLATLWACGAGTGERGGGASGVLARRGRCGRAARGPARGGVRRRASGRGPSAVRRGALAGLGFPLPPPLICLSLCACGLCACVWCGCVAPP